MRLLSAEFENYGDMPDRFTCTGINVNPELLIEDIPAGARSLALTLEDPDSAHGTWVHWLVYDIPVTSVIIEDSNPGKQGTNGFGRKDYGGPCPAQGKHRYVFTVYALDTELALPDGIDIAELRTAMDGHVLAEAVLTGRYEKPPVPSEERATVF